MSVMIQELSIDAILQELGKRLEQYRLNRNITQAYLAKEAGVSERTVIRVEQGLSVQMANFVKIINVLGLSDNIDALIPVPVPSPIQQLSLRGKERQRASSAKSKNESQTKWSWEDDT